MDLPAPLAWLVDEAGASPGHDRFLAELGGRLLADGLPLAGGALTLAVPHPIIARPTWLWRGRHRGGAAALARARRGGAGGPGWAGGGGTGGAGGRAVRCGAGRGPGRSAPPRSTGCAKPRASSWRP